MEDPTIGDELKAILPMLRADPSQFVNYESTMNNPVDNIRKLADMKQHVNSMLFQLGLARKPSSAMSTADMATATAMDAEPSARNPMHPDPDRHPGSQEDRSSVPLHHTVVSTISSISSTVSAIWAKRLNAIDPTQGRLEIVAQQRKHSPSLSHSPMKVKPKWPDFLVLLYVLCCRYIVCSVVLTRPLLLACVYHVSG